MAENEKVEQNTQPASSKADKAKKDKKSEKKPGVFARIGRWFHELKVELKGRVEEGRLAHQKADPQQHPDRYCLCDLRGHLHLAV